MSVYIKRNRKSSDCKYCGKEIKHNDFVVIASFYKKQKSGKIWSMQLKWHCRCWIKQGIKAVEEQELREPEIEKVSETRGRKVRLVLTEEQLHMRKKIMMRRAAVVGRIKKEVRNTAPSFDKIVRLGVQLDKCKEQIEAVGGIPSSWKD